MNDYASFYREIAQLEREAGKGGRRKPRNRGKQDVTPASWEYASPAGLQEDATPDEPYVGPSAQEIGVRSPPAPPSASDAPAPRRLGAPVRDDSWLPQDWQGMAPEANDPLTAIRARTAQIDAGRQSDRPAWEAAAGRVLPEETQPAAGAPFQTYYDSHLPLIIEGPRRLAEEAISLGADSLTWPIDQGARDRMDNRAEFLGRFARGLGDAAHDLGNTVDNWSIDEDTSIAGRERQAAEQERNFQRNIRLNDYVEQIRRPERYLGTSEVLNVTVPGPSMGERVGRFVDETFGYRGTEDFLRDPEAQYQGADFLGDIARERENARRLGVAPENMPDTSMAPLPSDQYESQAEAASVPVGLTVGLSALEFVPGVGLVPDLAAAGRATARGVGRDAWRLGQRVGVLDATDELPYAFVAREGAEDAPGMLTGQYRDRIRTPVIAAGVTGAGVEAGDGNFGDDPLASTIAAGSAAALTRRLGATAAEAGAERVVANRLREGSGVEPSNAEFFPTNQPAEMAVREYQPAEGTVVRVEPDGRVVMTYQGAYQSGASDARAAGSGAEAVRTWRATLRALEDDIAATQRPEYHWTPGPDGAPDERLANFYREAMSRRAPEGYVFSETPDGVMHLTRERPVRFGEELDVRTGEIRPATPIDINAPDLRLADDLGLGNYPRRDPTPQSESSSGIPPRRLGASDPPDAGAGSVEQRPRSAAEHARMMADAQRRLNALAEGIDKLGADQAEFTRSVDAMRQDARAGAEARAARFAEAERILREAGALPDVPDGGGDRTGSATRVYHATNREGFDVPTRDRTRRGEGISVSTNRDVAAEYGDRVIDLDLRGNYPDIASAEMEAVQRQWAATRAETGRTFEEELLAQGFDGYRDGDTIFVSRDNMLSRAQPNASSAPELPTRGSGRRLGDTTDALALAAGAGGAAWALSDDASADDMTAGEAIDAYGQADTDADWQIVPPRGDRIPSLIGARQIGEADGEYLTLETADGRRFRMHVMRGFDADANQPGMSMSVVGELVPRQAGADDGAQGDAETPVRRLGNLAQLGRPIASTAVGLFLGQRVHHPVAGPVAAGASAYIFDAIGGGSDHEALLAGAAAAGLRGAAPAMRADAALEAAVRGPAFEARRDAYAATLSAEPQTLRGTRLRGDDYLGSRATVETDAPLETPMGDAGRQRQRIIVPGAEAAEQGYTTRLGASASPREQFESLPPVAQLEWMNEAEAVVADQQRRLGAFEDRRGIGGGKLPAPTTRVPEDEASFPIGFYDPKTGRPLFGSNGRQPPPPRPRKPFDELSASGQARRVGSAADQIRAAREMGVGDYDRGADAMRALRDRAASDPAFMARLRDRFQSIAALILGGGAVGSEVVSGQRRLGASR